MPASIAIIDYGCGNLRSVENALVHVGANTTIVSDPDRLSAYSHLLLPGVGSFRRAMEQMRSRSFDAAIRERVKAGVPLLGICLGMQLLGKRSSEDGETAGLGLIECEVDRFSFDQKNYPTLKIPHVGFNSVLPSPTSRLFAGMGETADFYFTHSYRMRCFAADVARATCWHGEDFVAAVEIENIAATQFHPEKSQTNGLQLLKNFLERF